GGAEVSYASYIDRLRSWRCTRVQPLRDRRGRVLVLRGCDEPPRSRDPRLTRALRSATRAPGFVQGVSHNLGLKADRALRQIAGQGEFLAIASREEGGDRLSFTSIRGRRDTHGDDGLSRDDMSWRAEHVREE